MCMSQTGLIRKDKPSVLWSCVCMCVMLRSTKQLILWLYCWLDSCLELFLMDKDICFSRGRHSFQFEICANTYFPLVHTVCFGLTLCSENSEWLLRSQCQVYWQAIANFDLSNLANSLWGSTQGINCSNSQLCWLLMVSDINENDVWKQLACNYPAANLRLLLWQTQVITSACVSAFITWWDWLRSCWNQRCNTFTLMCCTCHHMCTLN